MRGQEQEKQTAKRPFNTNAKKCGLFKDKEAPISFKTRTEVILMCIEHLSTNNTSKMLVCGEAGEQHREALQTFAPESVVLNLPITTTL